MLRRLSARFKAVPPYLAERVRSVPSGQMPGLLDVALTAVSLDEVAAAVEGMTAGVGNGSRAVEP